MHNRSALDTMRSLAKALEGVLWVLKEIRLKQKALNQVPNQHLKQLNQSESLHSRENSRRELVDIGLARMIRVNYGRGAD
jgi:hypothetical protein